jgi:hypothetical protein
MQQMLVQGKAWVMAAANCWLLLLFCWQMQALLLTLQHCCCRSALLLVQGWVLGKLLLLLALLLCLRCCQWLWGRMSTILMLGRQLRQLLEDL